MSESLGNTTTAVAEQSPTWQRIIDAVALEGNLVHLKLTQHDKVASGAYILCSFDDNDNGEPQDEISYEVPLTELGTVPDSFTFPKTSEVFSFRMVMSEHTGSGDVHTIQPGLVKEEVALAIDWGWSFTTPE